VPDWARRAIWAANSGANSFVIIEDSLNYWINVVMKVFVGFLLAVIPVIFAEAQSDSLFTRLDQTIEKKEEFVKLRLNNIEGLYVQLSKIPKNDHNRRFEVVKELLNEYKTFIYDSAFTYVIKLQQLAATLHDPVKIAYAKNQLGFVLLSSGMFKETLDSLGDLRTKKMPDSIRIDYYSIMARAYYDLGDFNKDNFYTPRYIRLGSQYLDSAMSLCKPASYNLIYLRGLKNIKNENSTEALADLNMLLTKHHLNDHQLAVTASTLSFFYVSRNEPDAAIDLLIMAAIADIRSATKETSAMATLAELLYKKGDIIRAHTYIQEAMDDAVYYGARQRKAQVGAVLPIIVSAKLHEVEEQHRRSLLYSGALTLITILILTFAIIIFKQLKKRKAAEKALQESNKIKEEYIGYYFNINSEYLGKIETFKKSIEMKLMTKKLDDIKFIVNGINLKREREELYHSFDKVFLKLFPDFVDVFNSFFKEEDKIVLKDGQLLNTELRIFALIRMGIHDTEKIARILDYSISTIYNYKTRIKSKSLIPNEEFEKRIMDIHAQ
jgi:tetratricopeptide (TPR) repeat protein